MRFLFGAEAWIHYITWISEQDSQYNKSLKFRQEKSPCHLLTSVTSAMKLEGAELIKRRLLPTISIGSIILMNLVRFDIDLQKLQKVWSLESNSAGTDLLRTQIIADLLLSKLSIYKESWFVKLTIILPDEGITSASSNSTNEVTIAEDSS